MGDDFVVGNVTYSWDGSKWTSVGPSAVNIGATGLRGLQGIQGIQGLTGLTGATGLTGLQELLVHRDLLVVLLVLRVTLEGQALPVPKESQGAATETWDIVNQYNIC